MPMNHILLNKIRSRSSLLCELCYSQHNLQTSIPKIIEKHRCAYWFIYEYEYEDEFLPPREVSGAIFTATDASAPSFAESYSACSSVVLQKYLAVSLSPSRPVRSCCAMLSRS